VRGRVENLSAAHPTDLRPRGACACLRYKTSHLFIVELGHVEVQDEGELLLQLVVGDVGEEGGFGTLSHLCAC
jgi:hypothetical protein